MTDPSGLAPPIPGRTTGVNAGVALAKSKAVAASRSRAES